MTNDERNFINKIRMDKSKNIPLFDPNLLNKIHSKITDKIQRIATPETRQVPKIDNKAQNVIQADIRVRESVKDLLDALSDLQDKDIAKRLIAEHIMILNDIFKMFE